MVCNTKVCIYKNAIYYSKLPMKPCPLCETDLQDGQLTCHKCGFMFASEPVKVKKPEAIAAPSPKLSPLMSICICAVILALGWLFFGTNGSSDKKIEAPTWPTTSTASQSSSGPSTASVFACAKTQLLSMLASPRSAKFPWVHTDAITQKLNDGTYLVSSYLDAQNGFGAMIRQDYICKVRFRSLDDCPAECIFE